MANKDSKTSEEILLPAKGENVAIALGKPKTAAFFYDRIWSELDKYCSPNEMIPEEIRCFGGTRFELEVEGVLNSFRAMKLFEERKDLADSQEKIKVLLALGRFSTLRKSILDRLGLSDRLDDTKKRMAIDLISREVAKSFSMKHGMPMIPIYQFAQDRAREYHEGDNQVVIACLGNLEIVDEDELTWEQVIEFRADKNSREKYRHFLHWIDKKMVGKSRAFIEDEISIRLEDYERAIKKHGIKTVIGTIEETLDGKYLLGASGIAGSLTLAGHPTLGVLAAGLLIGGKIGVKLMQTKLDFDDVERGPNSEISWVYEAKKLSK